MSAGYAVFVRHPGGNKREYIFRVPDALGPVYEGDVLLVHTKRGVTIGVASSDSFFSPMIEAVAMRFPGATAPLAEVIQVAGKVIRAHIEKEVKWARLNDVSPLLAETIDQCRSLRDALGITIPPPQPNLWE